MMDITRHHEQTDRMQHDREAGVCFTIMPCVVHERNNRVQHDREARICFTVMLRVVHEQTSQVQQDREASTNANLLKQFFH